MKAADRVDAWIAEKEVAPRRIPFQWASAINDDPKDDIREIVEGVLTAGGMSCMYGESNSGKSYFASDLGFSMVRGVPWLGKRLERGAVIYVAAEGAASIRQRTRAYRKKHRTRVDAFGLVSTSISLLSPSADAAALVALIKEKASEIGEAVLLVIIDTLARVMAGGDENAAQDMGRLVAAGDQIRHETGAHVLFVHHSGKNALMGARGHSSLRAALDTELEVTKDEAAKLHTVEIKKQRDLGSVGLRLSARFVPVELGLNQWDDPITACVVEGTEQADVPKKQPRLLRGVPKLAYDAITAAINLHGRHPQPVDFRVSAKGVTLDQARAEFARQAGHIESKHRASRFSSAVTSLKASGHVHGTEDWIWLLAPITAPITAPLKGGSVISVLSGAPNGTELGAFGDFGDGTPTGIEAAV